MSTKTGDSNWKEIQEMVDSGYMGSHLTKEDFEHDCINAELNGFEVVVREPNQLLLDLDTMEQVKQYEKYASNFEPLVRSELSRWDSKDGGLHVIVELFGDISPLEAIAIQAMLGSDPMREFLNLIRLHQGVEEPSRLFKPGRVI